MKKCPQCGREYDLTMSFCLDDGSELLYGPAKSEPGAVATGFLGDEPQTAIFPNANIPGEPATKILDPSGSAIPRTDDGFWVAVLPFKWRGADADLEALSEGLSEDIVTGLSRFSYLRVIARSSTLHFSSDSGDVRAIGRELGARYVMEGSLRRAGSQLRVAVQLVDASTGVHLWTETYNRSYSPEVIFEIQDDLVPRIVSTVADWYGALPHSMSEAVRLKAPDQLSSYEAVLRSFGYFERIAPDEHAAVRAGLERAVKQAPGNADGWAMLAMIYGEEHRFGFNAQPDPLGRSLKAARRAVDAGHANNFAWLALAQALFFRKEFSAFREAAERAIELNPMDGSTLEYLAHLLAFAGDWDRGCELGERARQLNPNHSGWYWAVHGLDAYRKGDYPTATAYLQKPLMRGGGADFYMHTLLSAAYGQLGDREAADKTLQVALVLKPDLPETVRGIFEKWYLPELVEQLMEGLRKAGLKEPQTTETERHSTEASPSVAVLPFANMSADEENEYFCDGLAEELLNALAKIDGLKVAARTSAFAFKGKDTNIREIAETLGVKSILEGSVRKSANRLRITAQLINAADGYHLWSERYDREMKDIFDIQDEIAVAVVDALKIKLLGDDKAALLKRHTQSPEAHEFYLRGLSHFAKWTPGDFHKAIENFEKAIAIDPAYASAYAGVADSYTELSFFSFSPIDARSSARDAANKALQIDPDLAEAHNSVALIKLYFDWDYPAAEAAFKKAIALNPGSAIVHMWYGWFLGLMARFDESLRELRRAHELDPLSGPNNNAIGVVLLWSGQTDRAIEQFKDVLELIPGYPVSNTFLAEAYAAKGDMASAIATIEKTPREAMDPQALGTTGYIYAVSGDREKAQKILEEFATRSSNEYVPALNFAQIYSGLGDHENALARMDEARVEGAIWIPFLKVDLKFAPLRSDPRFIELLRKVGFAD